MSASKSVLESLDPKKNTSKNSYFRVEVLALFLSIVAILISLLSVYYTFFHRDSRLIMSCIAIDTEKGEKSNFENIIPKIAVRNPGNLNQYIVSGSIMFHVVNSTEEDGLVMQADFPICIKPGEAVIISGRFEDFLSSVRDDFLNEPTIRLDMYFVVLLNDLKEKRVGFEIGFLEMRNREVDSINVKRDALQYFS